MHDGRQQTVAAADHAAQSLVCRPACRSDRLPGLARWAYRFLPAPSRRCTRKALRSGGGSLLWSTWTIRGAAAQVGRQATRRQKTADFGRHSQLSRWGRSTTDLLATLKETEVRRVSVVALNGMTVDLATPHDDPSRMMRTASRSLMIDPP
jgi:hypothetical protein